MNFSEVMVFFQLKFFLKFQFLLYLKLFVNKNKIKINKPVKNTKISPTGCSK